VNFRNTLIRFTTDRLPNESQFDFLERSSLIANERKTIIGIEYSLDTEEYTSYIFDESDDSEEGIVITAVTDIYEVPQKIDCDFFSILLFHNNIKKIDENHLISDIDLDEAEDSVLDQIILMKSAISHIKNLKQRSSDF
jgi:hypothetical protein